MLVKLEVGEVGLVMDFCLLVLIRMFYWLVFMEGVLVAREVVLYILN